MRTPAPSRGTSGAFAPNLGPAAWQAKGVHEIDARFSPQGDHVFVAYSRAHWPLKLSYRGRKVGQLEQPSAWCTPLAASPEGRWLAARQSGVGVIVSAVTPFGSSRTFFLSDDGSVGEPLDGEPLPDREHVVATQRLCASTVVRADDPSALVVSAEVEGVTIGFLHVDLAVRRVVAQDLHIRRVHVFSLEGERVASLDALGATYPDPFHFGQAARWLWILERDGRLRRFDLEALA